MPAAAQEPVPHAVSTCGTSSSVSPSQSSSTPSQVVSAIAVGVHRSGASKVSVNRGEGPCSRDAKRTAPDATSSTFLISQPCPGNVPASMAATSLVTSKLTTPCRPLVIVVVAVAAGTNGRSAGAASIFQAVSPLQFASWFPVFESSAQDQVAALSELAWRSE